MVPYYAYTQTGAELLMVTLAHWLELLVMLLAVLETVLVAFELEIVALVAELLQALSLLVPLV